ncbi:MAG TPA: penicillin-binding protein activator LpoB [Opitutales bacterium]|nr:penicillin-binding protein activator LpoB [Opitutales bacterium]
MKLRYAAAIAALSLALAGCETAPVKEVSATDNTHATLGVDQSDVNATVEQMVNSMLSAPSVIRATGSNPPPTVVVVPIRLDTATITDTRINTDAITTLVRGKIINSGIFQFVDATRRQDIAGEVAYQQDSGQVNAATAAQRGRQIGSDYILEGTISGFDSMSGRTHKKGYVITLTLQNVETAVILWQETKQTAKEQTRRN